MLHDCWQIRAIKNELGENDDDEDDVVSLEKKMQEAAMPPNVWKHAQRELRCKINQCLNTILMSLLFSSLTSGDAQFINPRLGCKDSRKPRLHVSGSR